MISPTATDIAETVRRTLAEDVGSGDLTAALVPADATVYAVLVTRQAAVLCGSAWFDEVFHQLDPAVRIEWQVRDGDAVEPGQTLCTVSGPARPILTGERSAINLLQTLSATATVTRRYAARVRGTGACVLDTRKTIPGLRLAQKYAVRTGGGHNHRIGLFDGILIKENHIRASGSVGAAVNRAREAADSDILVEVEVETLEQLDEAIAAGATRILLDNFDVAGLRDAVARTAGRAELEASGNVT
ncbi:MAG: carboxylating nicotinate-nucleotide diphosphorylase, partial [Gammaproteobacteria bacterium]|nr:carboxylating nicotinate-nucleotide diphosphorylase [Gammaproteobacteria bacterium]